MQTLMAYSQGEYLFVEVDITAADSHSSHPHPHMSWRNCVGQRMFLIPQVISPI